MNNQKNKAIEELILQKVSDSNNYINRELSWIEFNNRVLQEAQDKNNPIFERLKFLAITSSNLDEFFMVRVAALWDQVVAGYDKKDASGLLPEDQIPLISLKTHDLVAKQYTCLSRSLLIQLDKEGFSFPDINKINEQNTKYIKEYFNNTIFPILTPMAIDQSRPFPLLGNKTINTIVQLDSEEDYLYAVVQIPTVVDRIIELPRDETQTKRQFVFLDDIIKKNISQLFQGHKVLNCYLFRITRNADLTIEEDAEDLLVEIEKSIKRRKWGEPIRLEVEKSMDENILKYLTDFLDFDNEDVFKIPSILDLTVFFSFYEINGNEHLKNKVLPPLLSKYLLNYDDIFEKIKQDDILVHHPYHTFDSVSNFVKIASEDPQTLAIKQTLYRVSGNSPIINSLIRAAENGKQVTVLVELKARFDEENNIIWAKKLEQAGCHVVYGLTGLKTHCKICLVVRKEDDGIHRYVHLGTGNYNDSTAKIYTDLGYFTSRETFGSDVSALFNTLTGYSQPPEWKKISVAPTGLRQKIIELIQNEIIHVENGIPSKVIFKMNSLVDTEMIKTLFMASIAGVKITLIVRGICCLKPGIPEVSENINVISIVDRFLEHSRIYFFSNNDNPKILLSSADLMPRNLDRRVEVAFPIEDERLKNEVIEILNYSLSDNTKARVLKSDGSYVRINRRGQTPFQSQLAFYKQAEKELSEALENFESDLLEPNYTAENISWDIED